MYNLSSVSIITKAGLVIGVMLALFLLSSSLYDSAHARTAPEEINYEERRTDAVAAFTAVDPEGHGIQWTLAGDDALDFDITGGALTFKSTPDFENPVDDDSDNVYEVTVQADDGDSTRRITQVLIVKVINVDEDGEVTLSALQPQEGIRLTAKLIDADGAPVDRLPITTAETDLTEEANNTKWRWSRSATKTGTFTDIAGATTANRTPTEDDVDMYLRATATYDDREGEGKTAQMVSDNQVREKDYKNARPRFENVYGEVIAGTVDGDVIDRGVGRSVAEDADPDDPVGGPVVASDDARDVLTYTLTGAAAGPFDIDSGTGQIKVGAGVTLDAETAPSYTGTVTATDPPGLSAVVTVTITVVDVDEAPVIEGGVTAKDYPEIIDDSLPPVVETYTGSDQEDTTPVRWSLSGADSGKFSIAANGDLTFNDPPDFEAEADANSNNIYEVTVTATDSTGNTASRDVTVNVTNVDELGVVTLSTLQPEAGTELRAELTDPDDSISGLTWRWSKGGNQIPGATSSTYIPKATPNDTDVGSFLTVTATYNDGAGGPRTLPATTANAVQGPDTTNKPPKFPDQDPDRSGDQSSSTSRSVDENMATGRDVGAPVEAEDCDPDPNVDPPLPCTTNTDNLTYSLEGRDAASFDIVRATGQLRTKAALDHETKRSYTVTVKATDPTSASDTISVTITVTDMPEAPVISGDSPGTYAEKGTAAVAAFTARDPERDPVTWTLAGTDADDFSITNGTLRFISPPDYETPTDRGGTSPSTAVAGDRIYEVTVRASDGGQATTAEKPITVTVLNLDEPGTVMLSTVQPKDGVAVTATLSDPDGTVTGESWQWAQSSSRTGTFTNIRNATNPTFMPGDNPDTMEVVEPSYAGKYLRATVTYRDPQSTRITKTAFVASTRAVLKEDYENQAPVFPDQNPDTEAIDNTATSRTIPEDTAPGKPVGDPVKATDMGETRPETLTYTLTGANASLFSIDRMTGQIRVGQGTVLNFNGDELITGGNNLASYEVIVTATDPGGLSTPITVTITVTNVDEAPTIAAATADNGHTSKDHPENSVVVSMPVSTYSATDPEDDTDEDIDLKWSLSGNDADLFCIGNDDGNPTIPRGQLRFNAPPNFEAPVDAGHNNTYNVTVVVTDSRGNTATRDVVVTVTNVEEAGTVTLSTVQPEDGEGLSAVLNDLDGRTTSVKWQWYRSVDGTPTSPLGNAPDIADLSLLYAEEPATGVWEKIAGKTSATYTPVSADVGKFLLVTATYSDRNRNVTDDDNSTDEDETKDQARVVSDNAVQGPDTNNKPPKFPDRDTNTAGDQKDQTRTVAEGTAADQVVGEPVTANDCDHAVDQGQCNGNTDNLTYSLSGTDAPSFSIDRRTGQLLTKAPLDYETKQTYTVTVKATDPSDESDSITVTITVTGINEPPTLSKRALVISGRSNVDHPEEDTRTVATYTAVGPEATRVSWSLLGDDFRDFSISGGRLTFRGTPNYESPVDQNTDNSYHVTVRAAGGGFTATRAVTVRVVNEDEEGTLVVSPRAARVGVELTATLTDPDGRSGDEPPITAAEMDLTDDAAWLWAKSPDGSTGWTTIAGANANTYTPDADDVGSYLRATANYTDGEGFGKSAEDESGRVTAVRPDGRVTLSSPRPEVGLDLTATLTDPDGGVSGLTWQWARSPNGTTGWGDIFGATSGTYRPVPADLGDYLRATATYTDAEASGQTAEEASAFQVVGSTSGWGCKPVAVAA